MSEDRRAVLLDQFKKSVANSHMHVFSLTQILSLMAELRAEYPFPRSLTERKFLRSLIDSGFLKGINLTASYSFETTRYHVGPLSDYELALSLKPGAYLSHGTAAHLHNLVDQEPKIIYVNKEQSPKNSKGTLTQAGIHKAFANKQRTSAYIVTHQETSIVLLSGKHSGRLGVTKTKDSQGAQLDVTDVDRTIVGLVQTAQGLRPTPRDCCMQTDECCRTEYLGSHIVEQDLR